MAKSKTRQSDRTEYRDEFYRDLTPAQKKRAASGRNAAARRGKRKVSIWVPVFGLILLLCVIGFAGSSAMIWLRKLGTLFGVEWTGDF